jgi:4-oxalmesaconate hydratase
LIIDAHAHTTTASSELFAYSANLLNTRGLTGRGSPGSTDEQIEAACQIAIGLMDRVGTDIRFTSPRPYLMHSERPARIVHWWIEAVNDNIARMVKAHPDRFQGIGALPQVAGADLRDTFDELDRCINQLGFIGITLNPDPGEGDNQTPTMGEEYWYPLYERLVAMDVPALIHSTSCRVHQRESYLEHFMTEETIATLSLCRSRVFQDFPTLKLIISHGGGSVPYQIGRWRSVRIGQMRNNPDLVSFDESMSKLWFDTCLYTQNSIDLLLKEVGPEHCLFGTEKPGVGNQIDPATGEEYDDVKPKIDRIGWLTEQQRRDLFENNARKVYTRWRPAAT